MLKPALLAPTTLLLSGVLVIAMTRPGVSQPTDEPPVGTLAQADALFNRAQWNEAFAIYKSLATQPDTPVDSTIHAFNKALDCLNRLGRLEEIDPLRTQVIQTHAQRWQVLEAAGQSFLTNIHQGYRVAGEFKRGFPRGGGAEILDATDRDRVQALRLFRQALPLALEDDQRSLVAQFLLRFGRAFFEGGRGQADAWRLQELTNLDELPDYETGGGFGFRPFDLGFETVGAPVDADGNPIYYTRPASFEEAANDGQRWRWLTSMAVEVDPSLKETVQLDLADFLISQFGVQTLAGELNRRGDESGPLKADLFKVHELNDNETLARLANGIKRFELPEEFQYLRIYREVSQSRDAAASLRAARSLANAYTNRRQFPKAAQVLRDLIARHGPGPDQLDQKQLDQIVEPWGRFENGSLQPAGRAATLDYVFRNGKRVEFKAYPVKRDQLLADFKAYLASKPDPEKLDSDKLNLLDLATTLVTRRQNQYLLPESASWSVDLTPDPNHFDRRQTIATPLSQPGIWLVTGVLENGNVARSLVWIGDLALILTPLKSGETLVLVADATTGQPLPNTTVEFLGWGIQYLQPDGRFPQNRARFVFESPTVKTDANGLATIKLPTSQNGLNWTVVARADGNRLGVLNSQFSGAYVEVNQGISGLGFDEGLRFQQVTDFFITDRPVYRPAQPVHYKVWLREVSYDPSIAGDRFANQKVTLEIINPRGETVHTQVGKLDRFGGLDGTYELASDVTLGVYSARLNLGVPEEGVEPPTEVAPRPGRQGIVRLQPGQPTRYLGSFRVEEYKKPEFEVTVTPPSKPVRLGDRIEATIAASYYFGGPVTHATVRYTVTRTSRNEVWFPPQPWDWLYGRGSSWLGINAPWYRGWADWGTIAPDLVLGRPGRFGFQPPEKVAQLEVPIGPDGTVKVVIDTEPAKIEFGDTDHTYTIQAEVIDESRRTVTGSGSVIAARKPFTVTVWTNRGFVQVGDVIPVESSSRTPDGQPVQGKGTLRLLKVAYDEQGQPIETAVETVELNPDAAGTASYQFRAAAPGQYRVAHTVTDDSGQTIEGGTLILVRGSDFDGRGFRFNDLELLPDKTEYAPGETAKLLINTDRPDSRVWLFLRPENGLYPKPILIRIRGKTTVYELPIETADTPNLFVEALTISNGRVHRETRRLLVPPVKRVLDVTIEPSQTEYLPGAPAKVRVKVTGPDGAPVVGSTVLSIYDRAIDAIAGGTNVADIRSRFWSWTRGHFPQGSDNLNGVVTFNLLRPNELPMLTLGLGFLNELTMSRGPGEAVGAVFELSVARRGMADRAATPALAGAAVDALNARMAVAAPAALSMEKAEAVGMGGGGGGESVEPTIRAEFADTALWRADLVTNSDGIADVELTMPENLAGWSIRAWSLADGTRVGEARVEVKTTKNVLVRLQAPRFFVERDEVVLSANIRNGLAVAKTVQAVLDFGDSSALELLEPSTKSIDIPAGGEARADWRVKAVREGEAVVIVKALTDVESDAMRMTFPVLIRGFLRTESLLATVRPNDSEATLAFEIPQQIRPDQTRLEVRYSPTLAGAMLDALPYLVAYPYGCTEQTLNRFLPAVITRRTLIDAGIDLADLQKQRTNLNAQELGAPNDPKRRPNDARPNNPIFDQAELDRVIRAGVERLVEMQLSNGGWGWFSGIRETASAHLTAQVVHGLRLARAADVAVPESVLERGVEWLKGYQGGEIVKLLNATTQTKPYKTSADNLDALVFAVLAEFGFQDRTMNDFLDRDRTKLSPYGLALYGQGLQALGTHPDRLAETIRNLDQFLVVDDENQTAHLRLPGSVFWWFWFGDEIETQAAYLKLRIVANPHDPVAPGLVKYLLNNRRHATYWNSTRDTALVVEAFAAYLKATGEAAPNLTLEVVLDDKVLKTVEINAGNLFTFDNAVTLAGDELPPGPHQLTFRKRGEGTIYASAYVTTFDQRDRIPAAGLELKIDRAYYKLTPREEAKTTAPGLGGRVVELDQLTYDRTPIEFGTPVVSGDLIEVELTIDSKNDYEYLQIDDFKAAGYEPVSVLSGYDGNPLGAYVEYRDQKVGLFVRTLPRGRRSVSYRLRAEVPGVFTALPSRIFGMYAPELIGNSPDFQAVIEDRPKP